MKVYRSPHFFTTLALKTPNMGSTMPRDFKVTTFIEWGAQKTGWTMNLYKEAADYTDVKTAWDDLMTVFTPIIMDEVQVTALRISDVQIPGDAYTPSVAGLFGAVDGTTHPPCAPWDALLIKTETGDHERRAHLFVHGVPVDYFLPGRLYNISNWNATAVSAFMSQLVTDEWRFRSKKADDTAPVYAIIEAREALRRTEHRVGRPFSLLVGRRRRRAPAP